VEYGEGVGPVLFSFVSLIMLDILDTGASFDSRTRRVDNCLSRPTAACNEDEPTASCDRQSIKRIT